MQSQQVYSRKLAPTRYRIPFTVKAALLALTIGLSNAGSVSAGEQVTFETPPVPQSAFKIRRAEAQGITLEPTPGITLSGILSMPEGEGPYPAMIILPESVEARQSYVAWAEYLTENGFVTLLVESLISRDETILRDDLPMNLLVDAHGALAFLANLDSVDQGRVGLLGIGMSGWFVQRSLDVTFTRGLENLSFYAGVVIYPHCNPNMELEAPILVLAGGIDYRMSLAACQALIDTNKSNPQTELHVYPQATHYFDNIAYAKNPEHRGENWVEPIYFAENHYDPELRADAEQRVLEFLGSVGNSD